MVAVHITEQRAARQYLIVEDQLPVVFRVNLGEAIVTVPEHAGYVVTIRERRERKVCDVIG